MKIRCKLCNTIIEGDKKGTLIWCECGKCFIDETKYYTRIGGYPEYVEEVKEDEQATKKKFD